MFRAGCSFKRKLVYIILNSILYSSWLLGIFPFKYEPKQRRLLRCKWIILYGITLSSGLLFLMIRQNGNDQENGVTLDVFQRNFVLRQISSLLGIVGVLTICTMYLRTFWRSKSLEGIYNDLLLLEVKYFGSKAVECPKFDGYVIQKAFLVVSGMACTWLIHFGLPNQTMPIANVFVVLLVKLGTILLAIHFLLGVAFIYRFLWLINRELLEIVSSLRANRKGSSTRVRLLLKLYNKLVNLYGKLTDCYDYQMVLIMAVFVVANIIVCFYMIVYRISLSQMSLFVMLIMFPLAVVNNFLDFWLSVAICDLVERTGRQTSMILKLFNDVENMDKDLEKSISDFALYCSHRRFKFLHCGLFHINREMGFEMLVTSVLYLLFLVQFDFMNL
ncbi:LOW QUALITY PROTEIN: putative gustatory receptor 22d [Drosophila eugracilis]|uniref:LOW QUALITY PROTEIN: putative gustatory receptor 22d n=1 Tax=Drosophila eugracilis TaxID=29029 RepID=UPI001BDB2497|nr:LOW QUALITY PROTEIN: putative gustatory receptor 22d [Drosophila eugracilis]